MRFVSRTDYPARPLAEAPPAARRTGPNGVPVSHARPMLTNVDESLAKIARAHAAASKQAGRPAKRAPASLGEAVAALERFLAVALAWVRRARAAHSAS